MDIQALISRIAGTSVRHALTGIGGILVTKGWIAGDDWELLVTGIAMAAAAFIWSLVQKWQQTKQEAPTV